jgi:PAS domain S-box-containing protein
MIVTGTIYQNFAVVSCTLNTSTPASAIAMALVIILGLTLLVCCLNHRQSGQVRVQTQLSQLHSEIAVLKQVEADLQKQRKFLNTLLENLTEGVVACDALGTLTLFNRATREYHGLPEKSLPTEEWAEYYDLYLPDGKTRMTMEDIPLFQAFQGERVQNVEMVVAPKDGPKRTLLASGQAFFDAEGKKLGAVVVMHDITQHKAAQEALTQANEELELRVKERTAQLQQTATELACFSEDLKQQTAILQLILNSMGDGVIVADEKGKFLIFNPAAEEMFGIGSTDTTPDEWSATYGLFLPDGRTPYAPADLPLARAIRGFSVDALEIFVRHARHPEGLWTKVNGRPLFDDTGMLRGRVIVCRNVTGDKQAEETLRQSEAQLRERTLQLEHTLRELQQTQAQLIQTEKMSSLGQLVAGVAHEINNPVNFIYGNLIHTHEYVKDLLNLVQLYQENYPEPVSIIQEEISAIDLDFLEQDLPKMVSSMKIGAERIREIVLSLRNFSRLDEAEKKAVDIHEGLDNTLLLLQNRLKAKPEYPGILVIKEYNNLPLVECYAGQLNQVFMNILTNAIDALDELNHKRSLEEIKNHPSSIRIRTELLNSDQVMILIADNGPGMTESVRSRLFDPFFTTKPVGQGTGLGMSISYSIVVEKHGGQLQCFSAPAYSCKQSLDSIRGASTRLKFG